MHVGIDRYMCVSSGILTLGRKIQPVESLEVSNSTLNSDDPDGMEGTTEYANALTPPHQPFSLINP
jgi:hypothetical protein